MRVNNGVILWVFAAIIFAVLLILLASGRVYGACGNVPGLVCGDPPIVVEIAPTPWTPPNPLDGHTGYVSPNGAHGGAGMDPVLGMLLAFTAGGVLVLAAVKLSHRDTTPTSP